MTATQGTATRSDSMLVLFPGSAESDEAVAILSQIGIYDEYMIRNRLRTRLPVLFAPCLKADIAGETGRRLSAAGIRFMSVTREVLGLPFSAFDAVRCQFDPDLIRIWDGEGRERTLYDREKVLVLEAIYDSKRRETLEKRKRKPSATGLRLDMATPETPAIGNGEPTGVLFFFTQAEMLPVRFMEEKIDFSFLGENRSLTAVENFRRLRDLIAERFGPVCRDMVTFAFGIESLTEDRTEKEDRRRYRQVQIRSNVSSVNTMARLFYCRWWQEKGWADYVYPP
jgi:hypothetical protein